MSQKFGKNHVDQSWPLRKGLFFTSLKTRQWLFFWNCSNMETVFDTHGIYIL